MAIVELRDVRKTYRVGGEDVHALDGVSLIVEQRRVHEHHGPLGSGKSTLLNMIGCLDRPTSGQVIIDGMDTGRLQGNSLAELRARKIGFVFQLHNLVPTLTALENVMLPLRYARMATPRSAPKRRWSGWGWATGWATAPRNCPAASGSAWLSRGRWPREPAIVLADEPTGALDSKLSAQVIDLMRDLNRESGQTFVIVTHDPAVAAQTERTIQLADGRVERNEMALTRHIFAATPEVAAAR